MQTVRHNGKIVSHSFLLFPPATKAPFSRENVFTARATKIKQTAKHLWCLFIILMSCFFPLVVFKNIRFFALLLFLQFSNELAHIAIIMRSKIFLYADFQNTTKTIFLCIYFLPCRASQQSVCSNNKINKNTKNRNRTERFFCI